MGDSSSRSRREFGRQRQAARILSDPHSKKKGMADFCFPETSRRISESLSSTKDDAEDLDLDVEFDGELSEVEEEDEEEEQGDTSKSEGGKAEDSSQKS